MQPIWRCGLALCVLLLVGCNSAPIWVAIPQTQYTTYPQCNGGSYAAIPLHPYCPPQTVPEFYCDPAPCPCPAPRPGIGRKRFPRTTVSMTYTVSVPETRTTVIDGKQVNVTIYRNEARTRDVVRWGVEENYRGKTQKAERIAVLIKDIANPNRPVNPRVSIKDWLADPQRMLSNMVQIASSVRSYGASRVGVASNGRVDGDRVRFTVGPESYRDGAGNSWATYHYVVAKLIDYESTPAIVDLQVEIDSATFLLSNDALYEAYPNEDSRGHAASYWNRLREELSNVGAN